jgi:hypothetical protein
VQKYITEELRVIATQDSESVFIVKGKLFNVHGEWAERKGFDPKSVYDVSDETTENTTTAHPTGDRTTKASEVKTKEGKLKRRIESIIIKTFPRNSNGEIGIPLGGVRGYISGMFRASARNHAWSHKGSIGFGMLSFIDNGGISFEPNMIWIPADKVVMSEEPMTYLIQRRNVFTYYDTMLEAPFEVKINITKRCKEGEFDRKLFLTMLADLERLPVGPKRRGTMKIDSVQEIS